MILIGFCGTPHLSISGHTGMNCLLLGTQCEHHSPLATLPPSLLSSPTILSSGLIQSILQGDCSREKDVAEANERIITTGSKPSGKSIPSGHDGFRMKQRKSKASQRLPCTDREGRDERADRVEEEKKDSHNVSISWRWPSHALLSD